MPAASLVECLLATLRISFALYLQPWMGCVPYDNGSAELSQFCSNFISQISDGYVGQCVRFCEIYTRQYLPRGTGCFSQVLCTLYGRPSKILPFLFVSSRRPWQPRFCQMLASRSVPFIFPHLYSTQSARRNLVFFSVAIKSLHWSLIFQVRVPPANCTTHILADLRSHARSKSRSHCSPAS